MDLVVVGFFLFFALDFKNVPIAALVIESRASYMQGELSTLPISYIFTN